MSHKILFALTLAGALSLPARQAIAQETQSLHQGPWPIQNGIKRQPTRNELRALHEHDVTPSDAREIDRLYNELLSTGESGTHHPGIARMR
jgi:hypothetical protein